MGFNIRYLPELDVLLERRKKYDSDEDFLWAVVGKSDSIIGPDSSIEYLDSIHRGIKDTEQKKEIKKGDKSK